MNPNSWFLPTSLLEDFKKFCASHGFIELTPVGEYEVLRMRPPTGEGPLLVFRKKRDMGYFTTYGLGKDMARNFDIDRRKKK